MNFTYPIARRQCSNGCHKFPWNHERTGEMNKNEMHLHFFLSSSIITFAFAWCCLNLFMIIFYYLLHILCVCVLFLHDINIFIIYLVVRNSNAELKVEQSHLHIYTILIYILKCTTTPFYNNKNWCWWIRSKIKLKLIKKNETKLLYNLCFIYLQWLASEWLYLSRLWSQILNQSLSE